MGVTRSSSSLRLVEVGVVVFSASRLNSLLQAGDSLGNLRNSNSSKQAVVYLDNPRSSSNNNQPAEVYSGNQRNNSSNSNLLVVEVYSVNLRSSSSNNLSNNKMRLVRFSVVITRIRITNNHNKVDSVGLGGNNNNNNYNNSHSSSRVCSALLRCSLSLPSRRAGLGPRLGEGFWVIGRRRRNNNSSSNRTGGFFSV